MNAGFWKRLGRMEAAAWFVLTRCLALSALSLLGALTLTLAAGPLTVDTYFTHLCAAALRDGGLLLFGAGLIGSALTESVLKRI